MAAKKLAMPAKKATKLQINGSAHTGCFLGTETKELFTALVVYHLESYGMSAFVTDNGPF